MTLTLFEALNQTNKLYWALDLRRPSIATADAFYRGAQPLAYASPEWDKAHSARYKNFSDNWCGVVGNSPVERLAVQGIRIGDDPDVQSSDEKMLMTDWLTNDMDAQSSQGFLQSVISKRSMVLVWGRNEDTTPVVTWEHPAQCIIGYDPGDRRRRLAALKTWIVDNNQENATLYTADEVWKFWRPANQPANELTLTGLAMPQYALGQGGWQARQIVGEPWPLRNPLGEVPMVEIPNRPMLGGDPISDIEGTMAMQNAINMLWAYLFVAADYASMPARVVLGMEPPKVPILDNLGQIIGSRPAKMEDLAEKRIMFLPGSGEKPPTIGQWDAAKLDVFTNVIETAVGHVAAQTRTPPHYLVTNKGLSNLSGDALVAAETGLTKKVEEFQLFSNSPIREVFRLMAKVRGNEALATAASTAVILWKDAETRSPAQMADAAVKDATIGLPLAYILEKRYGLPQKEIDRILALKKAEQAMYQPPTTEQIQLKGTAPGQAAPPAVVPAHP